MLTEFQKRVYNLLNKIPKGKVTTYKAIAKKLKSSPRAVGKALNKNPWPIKIPCHRVIKSNGKIGGYKLGIKNKIKLLKKEGIKIKNQKIFKFKNA